MSIPLKWRNVCRSALHRSRKAPAPRQSHPRTLPPPEVGPGVRNSRRHGVFQGSQPDLAVEIPAGITSPTISCTKLDADFDGVIEPGALPPRLGGKPEAPATSITTNEDN